MGAGKLNKAKNADRFLSYLASIEAPHIYASYGFLKAAAEELKLKNGNRQALIAGAGK